MATDKVAEGHNYYMVYDRLIATPPKRVLEIGIWTGHSLQGWAERWPEAEVHGIDMTLDKVEVAGPWHTHVGNAYDPAFMYEAVGSDGWIGEGFDLIVDDGPHTLPSQCFTALLWSECLRPGGWLFIEDVPSPEAALEIGRHFPEELQSQCFCIDLVGFSNEQYDSRIVATYRPEQ